jgi:hypothetical protein
MACSMSNNQPKVITLGKKTIIPKLSVLEGYIVYFGKLNSVIAVQKLGGVEVNDCYVFGKSYFKKDIQRVGFIINKMECYADKIKSSVDVVAIVSDSSNDYSHMSANCTKNGHCEPSSSEVGIILQNEVDVSGFKIKVISENKRIRF